MFLFNFLVFLASLAEFLSDDFLGNLSELLSISILSLPLGVSLLLPEFEEELETKIPSPKR